jgi:class 3 adenylate cyclase
VSVHRLTIHAIVFVAVTALLVFFWMLFGGSEAGLADVASEPTKARDLGFWPVWVIAPWLTALAIHAGVTATNTTRRLLTREPEPERRDLVEDSFRKTAEVATGLLDAAVERGTSAIAPDRDPDPEDAAPAPKVGASRWVAVMFTDIADSTSLTEELGDEAWHKILTKHRKIVRRAIADHNGEEVATQGDGFFIRYDVVGDAVTSAIAIQKTLRKRRHRDVPGLRIGIHAGEVVQDHDGDLMGSVINVAARVTDAAAAGEILVTESVADNAPTDVTLVDGGLRELKGVAQPRHVLRVDW